MPLNFRLVAARIALPAIVAAGIGGAAMAGAATASAAPAPASNGPVTSLSQVLAANSTGPATKNAANLDVTAPMAAGPHDALPAPKFGPSDDLRKIYLGPTGTPSSAPASTGGLAPGMDDAIADAATDASTVPSVVRAPDAGQMSVGHPWSEAGLWDKGSFYPSAHAIGGPVVK